LRNGRPKAYFFAAVHSINLLAAPPEPRSHIAPMVESCGTPRLVSFTPHPFFSAITTTASRGPHHFDHAFTARAPGPVHSADQHQGKQHAIGALTVGVSANKFEGTQVVDQALRMIGTTARHTPFGRQGGDRLFFLVKNDVHHHGSRFGATSFMILAKFFQAPQVIRTAVHLF